MNSNEAVIIGSYRQPSPTAFEAATELLHFTSQSSMDKRSPPLAPASIVALPASFDRAMYASAVRAAAVQRAVSAASRPSTVPNGFSHHTTAAAMTAAASCALPLYCTADGSLHTSSTSIPRACSNRPVDHTYTDYAPVSDQELRMLDQSGAILNDPKISSEKRQLLKALKEIPSKALGASQSFPSKLHAVISNPELSEIISWMPHGRCFTIHDPNALVSEVLPNYFNQSKFVSFVRQLNLWGFKRLTRDVGAKTYYHELFLRGRPYMALRLKRHKVKGHGFKPTPNPQAEPIFHSFSEVGGKDFKNTPLPKPVPKDENKKARGKKKIMLSRASAAASSQHTQVVGLGDLLPEDSADEKTQCINAKDSNFLASAIATAQARLAGVPGLNNVENNHQANTESSAARYATLLQLNSNARSARGRSEYSSSAAVAQSDIDDILSQRLAQLKKEQDNIVNLRRARMLEGLSASHNTGFSPYEYLSGLGSSAGVNTNPYAQLANGYSSRSVSDNLQMAIREAAQFEDMASASRNRARLLALADAMEAHSGYYNAGGQAPR